MLSLWEVRLHTPTKIFIAMSIAAIPSACDRAADPYLLGGDVVIPVHDTLPQEDASAAQDAMLQEGPDAVAPALATCGATPIWSTQTDLYEIVYGSPQLTIAPEGALAARSGGGPLAFYRMTDGTALGTAYGAWDEVLDASWESLVVVQQGEDTAWVEVQDARTGAVLHALDALPSPDPELDWLRLMRAFLTPDGTRLATMTCWSRVPSDSSVARLRLHALGAGTDGPIVDLDVPCGDNLWPRAAPGALSADGRTLVLTFLEHAGVFVVDLETGTTQSFDPVGDLPDAAPVTENWGYGNAAVFSVAIRPDGGAVALSDRAGQLTRWSLPDLESLGEPWQAGLVGINQNTYGPSMESPVAWSEDGALLAHLDEDGEAVIRRADDGVVLLTLPRPDLATEWRDDLFNPATGFRFSPDGEGILVSFEAGLELWRCPDAPPIEGTGAVETVSIVGPTVVAPYESHSWTATAKTEGQPVVFRLLLDGTPVAAGLRSALSATLQETGPHTLQVLADDGIAQASSDLFQVVVE